MDIIYGKEQSKYILQCSSLIDNTINEDTVDWIIYDELLNFSNNTSTFTDVNILFEPTKIFESSGTKEIQSTIEFDDGWGNLYTHNTNIEVLVKVYSEPVLDFTWSPLEPTILDNVEFTQSHDSTRDESLHKKYGRIDKIYVDFYNDSTYDIDYITKDANFQKIFSNKLDNIPVKIISEYWDGFETKSNFLIKLLNMSNIPPVSNWNREDKGICVPAFEWTVSSYDLDDNIEDLTYVWELYQEVGAAFNLIDTGTNELYNYPFQYEGKYRLDLITTDLEGSSNIKSEIFDITFGTCDSTGSGTGYSGKVILQPNRWQMVAIPVKNKKISDVMDLISTKANRHINELIEVVNAYPSNSVSNDIFLSFVPGFTNIGSSNNFKLIETDLDSTEITAFWIRTLEFGDNIIIEYTEDTLI